MAKVKDLIYNPWESDPRKRELVEKETRQEKNSSCIKLFVCFEKDLYEAP